MMRRTILIFSCLFLFLKLSAQTENTLYLNQQLPSNDVWWQLFGDSTLDSLIQQAVVNNYDLLNAIDNIELARTRLRIQQSGFYPEVTLSASYTPEKNSQGIEHINDRNYIGQAAVSMKWELDVFGSIRKSAESQRQYFYASQENYRAVMISLIAQVSSAYISLRTYQQQLEVALQNLQSQADVLNINEVRFRTGLTSQLSVAQAKSLYLQTKAAIPGIEAAISNEINSLSVLVGEFSDSLRQTLNRVRPMPVPTGIIMTGIPAELVRRRPDLRAAERQMDALAAAVGATRADWWPKFYVSGTFGYGSDKFKHFTKKENMEWQIGPSVQWTIFSGRRLAETTRSAQIQLDEGINNYNNTLLSALQEIDNALVSYNKSLQQLQADREAMEQAQETLTLAIDLYERGLTDYQNVLDSQRNVFSFQTTLVNAQSQTLLYMIQLYRALGGGWESGTNNE